MARRMYMCVCVQICELIVRWRLFLNEFKLIYLFAYSQIVSSIPVKHE